MKEAPQDRIGRRIRWLREARELTQERLSTQIGFNDRQTLSDIESGKRRVTPSELAEFARVLEVSVDELVDPFLLVGEGGFNFRADDVDPDVIERFERQAGRWIATYRELGRQAGIDPSRFGVKLELTRRSSFEDAAASAEALRRRWELGDTPAETLEQAIEKHLGVLVLYVDSPRGVSGAASHLPGLQTIMINRRDVPSRRIFDLAHELFHVLTWDAMPPARIEPSEPRRTKGNREEQLANVFAAALLMPASVVRARWERRGDADLRDWIIATARSLRVGPSALQYHLINLGLHSKRELVDVDGEAVDRTVPTPQLFSLRFVARVQEAVEAGRLSLRRAAELLGLSIAALVEVCRSYGRPLSYDN